MVSYILTKLHLPSNLNRFFSRVKKSNIVIGILMILIFLGLNGYLPVRNQNKIGAQLSNEVNGHLSDFCVLISYFNPVNYKSRLRTFESFRKHITKFDISFFVVELAFENGEFQVTDKTNPNHVQLRTNDAMFYKENLLNIGLKRLPATCVYVAWIDCDVEFEKQNWVQDTRAALDNKYKVVQLFDFAKFLDQNNGISRAAVGRGYDFVHSLNNDKRLAVLNEQFSKVATNATKMVHLFAHTGFGWAAKRETLLKINGFYDRHILGAGDYIMACSFASSINTTFNTFGKVSVALMHEIYEYENNVIKHVNKSFGYIPGAVKHLWHGSYDDRNYKFRDKIFETGSELFDPSVHIYYDENGLLRYTNSRIKDHLHNSLKEYFISRQEDKIPS